jgi:hypothetical protein
MLPKVRAAAVVNEVSELFQQVTSYPLLEELFKISICCVCYIPNQNCPCICDASQTLWSWAMSLSHTPSKASTMFQPPISQMVPKFSISPI